MIVKVFGLLYSQFVNDGWFIDIDINAMDNALRICSTKPWY